MKELLLCLLLMVSINCMSLSINKLTIDGRHNPSGLDKCPRLSWTLESSEINCNQVSYQITIRADEPDGTIVFDTGIISSSQNVGIQCQYDMEPLTKYYVSLIVSDNYGNTAAANDQYFVSGLMLSGWGNAKWITSSDVSTQKGMPQYRKTFCLQNGKTVKAAYLCSTALGIYDMYINGERVGHIQKDRTIYEELKPGWTDYRKRVSYSTHCIKDYLSDDEQCLMVQLARGWWNGDISASVYGENMPLSFLALIVVKYDDGTIETFETNETWKVRMSGPLREGDIYAGETYDARLEDGCQLSNYNDTEWENALIADQYQGIIDPIITPPSVIKELTRYPESIVVYDGHIDNGTDFGQINVLSKNKSFPIFYKKGQTIIIDFGQNIVGWTPFMVKGEEGTTLRIRYAEMLNDNGSISRGNDGPGGSIYVANLRGIKASLNYTLKGKGDPEQYIPISTYFGFRYCELMSDKDIEIINVEAVPVTSAINKTGNIVTDNSKINQLIHNIEWGQRGNFFYIPTDCPQRNERWGWTGDAQVFSKTGMYNFSTESFYGNYLQAIDDSQDEDGAYPDCAPHRRGRKFGNAGWGDAGIIIAYNHYKMYGDRKILENNFQNMENYMKWLASQEEDGFHHAGGGVLYGDWLAYDKCGNRYVSVSYYALVAKLMVEICQTLSENEDDYFAKKANDYKILFDEIKKEYKEHYWTPEPVEKSQTALLMALSFGLLEEHQKEEALALLGQAIEMNGGMLSTGFLGTTIFLPTLSQYGLHDEAYNLLLQEGNPSWLYSVNQGATTIWERWDSYTIENGFGPASMNSFNHYAYGAVGEWFYQYMLGIKPSNHAAGFQHFQLEPCIDLRKEVPNQQDKIRRAEGNYNSVFGDIFSRWYTDDDGNINYECCIPANTSATLLLPDVDGLEYFGKLDGSEKELSSTYDNKKCKYIYELTSGKYFFSTKKTTTAINEAQNDELKELKIEPAPSQSIIYFHEAIHSLQLFDTKGRLVMSLDKVGNTIDLSSVSKGCYILKVVSKGQYYTKKVIRN